MLTGLIILPMYDVTPESMAEINYTNRDVIQVLKWVTFFFHLGAFIVPALVFSRLYAFEPKEYLLNISPSNWKYFVLILLFFPILIILNEGLIQINMQLDVSSFAPELQNQMEQDYENMGQFINGFSSGGVFNFLMNVLLIAVVPAISEELVFRGVLQNLLVKWSQKVHLSVVFCAFLFAFLHFQYLDFLPRFFMGVMFGYIVLYTGNLIYTILLHFLNNLFALSFHYALKEKIITEESIVFHWYHYLVAVLCLGYFIYKLKKISIKDMVIGIYKR